MENTTEKMLQKYISEQISDSVFYEELAQRAENESEKQLLTDFAEDERRHIQEFKDIYLCISGKQYSPVAVMPDTSGDYKALLRKKMIRESESFRKFGEKCAIEKNETLREAFYRLKMDKGAHALQLLFLFED